MPQTKRSKILIVDDNTFDRKLLKGLLSDFEVVEADSGPRGVELLQSERIDLVLLDQNMPDLTGLETLSRIRATSNSINLPVIFVTGKADAADVVEALKAGANDYITKPVDGQIALARIMTHLRLKALSQEAATLKRVEALNAMIVTYNHEINSPLAVATLSLDSDKVSAQDLNMAREAVARIAEIVKTIAGFINQRDIELKPYTDGDTLMVDLTRK